MRVADNLVSRVTLSVNGLNIHSVCVAGSSADSAIWYAVSIATCLAIPSTMAVLLAIICNVKNKQSR